MSESPLRPYIIGGSLALIAAFAALIGVRCRTCSPLESEAEAHALVKHALEGRKDSTGTRLVIHDIDRQISNFQFSGPRMTFDPPGQRYVEFDLDTGCGLSVHPQLMINECGEIVNITPWESPCDAKRD